MNAWNNFKRLVACIPGTARLYHWLIGQPKSVPVQRCYLDRGSLPQPDFAKLELEYRQNPQSLQPETFVLYRIIGNDLVPRHRRGQSRINLQFILEHEPELAGCEKRFVINRIVDLREESAIIKLLDKSGYAYLRIPFNRNEYKKIPWDIEGVPSQYAPFSKDFAALSSAEQTRVFMRLYRHKNNYVMHNNGARNAALNQGRTLAKWVLPWDGNCFITQAGWQAIVTAVTNSPELPYFVVPMARITDNLLLLDADFKPAAVEEPQIIFRSDSQLSFSEDYFYGRRPKVELLWRLAVPGNWDRWHLEPWDLPGPIFAAEAGCFGRAGWVVRLSSGRSDLETDPDQGKVERGFARNEAIKSLFKQLDRENCAGVDFQLPLILQQPPIPENDIADCQTTLLTPLIEAARKALRRGPYSVTHKTTLPPSQDPHDYWHPAPYYWPNPLAPSGLPYISRDGERVPGTRLYEPESDQYDRTRLQRLFDDTLVLALAWQYSGEQQFATHAASLVRTWFLTTDTAMHPRLTYAQVRMGHNQNMGNHSGLIEMKDLYFHLEATKILQNGGFFSSEEQVQLKAWFTEYRNWLQSSPQGNTERAARNNHGLYYDLQLASIAVFLEDIPLLQEILRDSRFRILQHFDADGRQPEEMKRTTTAHYCCFNLQGWIHLAQLAEACGEDLWNYEGTDGRGIRKGMYWLLQYLDKDWPYQQIDDFDRKRFYPIYYACKRQYGLPVELESTPVPKLSAIKPVFYPHDGIRPFWQLGLI